ncbi:MAG: hypothetical protein ABIR18_00495 [Chitinophagaceae bacterium]
MKLLFFVVFAVIIASGLACSQSSSFFADPHAFIDQQQPGDVPQRFTPPRMTDSGYFVLGRVAFSEDGKEFYYGANNQWYSNDNQIVNYYRFENGSWKGPLLLGKQISGPTFSMDGKTLYVANNGVQQMSRTSSGWSEPKPYLNRSYTLYNFMPTKSGRTYVGSNGTWGARDDYSSWRFAVMPANIADTSIQNLGEPLNSPGFNGDFYIAPDESYMIISAKETKDFESELWISFRKENNTWTTPQSLGDAINSGAAHRFGQYVSPDGKFLFYTKGTSEKDCALYWVRFDGLLEKLRKTEK